jgi:CHRD domain-containing protein
MLMTRLLCGAAVAAALLISATPSSAQVVTLTATLNGGEETPALLTGAVGIATVSVDPQAEELAVTLSLFNLPTGTSAGHIHIAPKGIAGPVVINFPIPTGRTGDLPLSFRVSTAAFVARPEIGINTLADAIQSIVAGNSYVNIHTSQYPAGEIRGQLTPVVR